MSALNLFTQNQTTPSRPHLGDRLAMRLSMKSHHTRQGLATTPHYTTLHHITPHYTTIHRTTPPQCGDHNTQNYSTPHHTNSHYTTIHHNTPHYTTQDYTSLHHPRLHCTTPYKTPLHFTTQDYTSLHHNILEYSPPLAVLSPSLPPPTRSPTGHSYQFSATGLDIGDIPRCEGELEDSDQSVAAQC